MPTDQPESVAYLIADHEGRCLQVTRGWSEITGLDASLSSGDGWLDFAHPDDSGRLREEWAACVLQHCDLAVRVRRKISADPVDVRATAMPAGFVVTLQLAETKRNEAEILHARKMEAVGRLASGLAHDFANLLTLISGYSEILLGRLPSADPSRPEVDEIRKAANRGASLTSQLLAYSRRHAVEPQILDLNAVVAAMQSMLRRMIGEHIDLGTQLAFDLGSVKADAGQIEQVIMNLAINARDAMPDGGKISICTANVEVGPDHERARFGIQPGRYVMLQVTDTGQGMDPDTLEHLFEPFFTTKEKGKGTGLGLATVYGIVKQSQGDVWVQSGLGKGSTFTVYLPRVADQGAPVEAPAAVRSALAGTETILLVEDEEGVRRLLKHVLIKNGYTVIEAGSGPEALTAYQQLRRPIDLLLTDVVMPRMNGRELAERMAQLQPGLKIIYMSGYTDEAVTGPGTLGSLFLPKPLRPDVLAARVREVLDAAAPEGGSRPANRASIAPA